ncbi:hypothetical protein EPI10_025249 [Gossypium australe]|uniref:Uncharacterized protein n=1 Tax=Gossypium australe TaxID=47621 RepID=A0A5B6W0Y8_9ROSI|nr:hypothetical protein EPI10_025249 [Gossypium australe]
MEETSDGERRPMTGMASAGGVLRNEKKPRTQLYWGFLLLGLYITSHVGWKEFENFSYNLSLCVGVNQAWIMGLTRFSMESKCQSISFLSPMYYCL